MSLEIESLLYKQVKKPKNHLLTKVINLWDNRYRLNIYIETCAADSIVPKRTIAQSYFCHYFPGNLIIIDGLPQPLEPVTTNRLDTTASSGILVA